MKNDAFNHIIKQVVHSAQADWDSWTQFLWRKDKGKESFNMFMLIDIEAQTNSLVL